jgi:hypothetical protein
MPTAPSILQADGTPTPPASGLRALILTLQGAIERLGLPTVLSIGLLSFFLYLYFNDFRAHAQGSHDLAAELRQHMKADDSTLQVQRQICIGIAEMVESDAMKQNCLR